MINQERHLRQIELPQQGLSRRKNPIELLGRLHLAYHLLERRAMARQGRDADLTYISIDGDDI